MTPTQRMIQLETPNGTGAVDANRIEIISDAVIMKGQHPKAKPIAGRWITMQSGQKFFMLGTDTNKATLADATGFTEAKPR